MSQESTVRGNGFITSDKRVLLARGIVYDLYDLKYRCADIKLFSCDGVMIDDDKTSADDGRCQQLINNIKLQRCTVKYKLYRCAQYRCQ